MDEILAKVQANTGEFVQSLPDFVCDETITSKALVRGKLQQFVNESHFVGRQQKHAGMSFTETRDVLTINGKPVPKHKNPRGPVLFGGGFSSVLHETFGQASVPDHTYKIAGEESIGGKTVLVIEFATRQGQKTLFFDFYGKAYVQNDVGKVWVNKDTLTVLRLQRHYQNVPKGETPIILTVDYGSVQIDGKPYWMPVTVKAEQAKGKGTEQAQYLAEYKNYRKFDASSSIVY
jgi:hypothetical protein